MRIGIIGGADGPTAIYLASSSNWGLITSFTAVVIVVVLTFLIIRRKKNK